MNLARGKHASSTSFGKRALEPAVFSQLIRRRPVYDNITNFPTNSSANPPDGENNPPLPVEPDFGMARKFLSMLDPKAADFVFQVLDDNKKRARADRKRGISNAKVIIGAFDGVKDELAAYNKRGYGIFVTVNETNGRGRKKENIVRVRAVFQDLDGGGTIDEKQVELANLIVSPSIEVESSPGHRHIYYLCGLSHDDFEGCQRCLAENHGSDPNAQDLCRVLRQPGFINCKRREPFMVRLTGGSGECYSRELITAAFPPIARTKRTPVKGDLPYSTAAEALIRSWIAAIPGQKADAYQDWLAYGMALARLGGDWGEVPGRGDIRLELWELLSRKAEGFEDDTGCAGKWEDVLDSASRPHDNPATFRSLQHAAKEAGWTWENSGSDPALVAEAKAALDAARGLERPSAGECFEIEQSALDHDWRAEAPGENGKGEDKNERGTRWPPIVLASGCPGPIPDREWIVPDKIPAGPVSILSGDGGTGKTIIALQLAVARALARDWLSFPAVPGRTLYVSAEDDHDELLRRLEKVARYYGADRADLSKIGFLDCTESDAMLGAKDGAGNILATPSYRKLQENIADFQPSLVILDTLADVFGGDEIVRTQARQFVSLVRRLGGKSCTALMLAHPSLSGMASGSGTSGSTGWSNSTRSRAYLEANRSGDGRTLVFKKTNYGPPGTGVKLAWNNGVFIPVPGATAEETEKSNAEAGAEFLTRLAESTRRGENLSPSRFSKSRYAPKIFADGDEAAEKRFKAAMERLIDSGVIKSVEHGTKSKPENWLELAENNGG